jgi:hypothetical protein
MLYSWLAALRHSSFSRAVGTRVHAAIKSTKFF